MNTLKKSYERVHEYFTLMKKVRSTFVFEQSRKNMRKMTRYMIISTILLMVTPWVFGELVNYALQKEVTYTTIFLATVIAFLATRFVLDHKNAMVWEKNHGDTLPSVDQKIALLFSEKNIKQLRTNRLLSVGNNTKARGYINQIVIDINVQLVKVISDLTLAFVVTLIGSIYFQMYFIIVFSIIGIAISFLFSAYLNTTVLEKTGPVDKQFRSYNRSYEEVVQKFGDFKAQGMDANILETINTQYKDAFDADRAIWFGYIRIATIRQVLVTICLVIIPYIIGIMTIMKNPDAFPLVIALFSWGSIQVSSLRELARYERDLGKRLPAIASLFEAFALKPLRQEDGIVRFDKKKKFNIVFDNVSHRFEDGKLVLANISFKICSGEKWAFVGHSGSGKTTLVNLILGAMPPTEGSIRIEVETGEVYDLWDLDLSWWRSEVLGYVPQDVVLKDDTIRNNLLLAIPASHKKPTDTELMKTMERFQAIFRGEKDEHVLDIQVGRDGGVELSGGQRQRIGIVRAVLKQARLIIFDEATSSLDAQTTNTITKAFKDALEPEITSIMIAHNLSTVAGGNPEKLLSADNPDKLVCSHFLVINPITEINITLPQIDYVGSYENLSDSGVLKGLIKEAQREVIT